MTDDRQLSSARLRVLAVDDDPDTLEMLEVLLGSLGWSVTVAASSEAALERLSDARPDLILSDIGLPDMDGCALMRAIRSRENSRIPAIAVSGSGLTEDVCEALEAGFDAHLTKPLTLAALFGAVRRVLPD